MITKTLNLDDAYQDLFDEVRVASDGAIDVDNLEAFFGSIEDIALLKDGKFLRLPLDEPLFEIDANSRKINVPAEFKSNGVSVQGDHLAEIIFFRIARFFDYKDLSTCDIKINWKMGAKEGKTTRFIKFDDVMVEPGETKTECIIFGWPVNNVVTEKSGTLTFAVEFSHSEGKDKYCFNTLPITVNIKDGLILADDAEVFELDDDIINNLVNSAFGEGTAAVGDIQWLTGNGNGLVTGAVLSGPGGAIISFNPDAWQDTINLDTVLDNETAQPSSVGVTLLAQAFVDSGTVIRYSSNGGEQIEAAWVKLNETYVLADDRSDASKKYYVKSGANYVIASAEELADSSVEIYVVAPLSEDLMYYVQESVESPAAYKKASDEDLAKWGTVDSVDLYAKIATIVANEAGSYVIKAQGEKYDNEDRKIGSGEVKSSAVVTVPAAVAPSSIGIEVSARPEVGEDSPYSFAEGTENVVFLNDGAGSIQATPVVESSGALQYNWLKKNGDAFEPVAENVPFMIDTPSNTLGVSEAGEYKVSVVNFLNGTFADAVESDVVTVSVLAGAITGASVKFKIGSRAYNNVTGPIVYNSAGTLSANNVTLKVDDIVVDGAEGTIEYQWMKKVASEVNGEFVQSWQPVEGATEAEFAITSGDGIFYPVVKNNLNGSVYAYNDISGMPITVDDRANG